MTSIVIIIIFCGTIAWILINGSRHWNNVDERRKRIVELGGTIDEGPRPSSAINHNEEATERDTRKFRGAQSR